MTQSLFFVYLFFLHFLADFCLQTNWMAQGKSKRLFPLITHVLVYGLTFFIGLMWNNFFLLTVFTSLNMVLHFITDYFTSKINSKLWVKGMEEKNLHNFFVGVGLDQTIHYTTLIITSYILKG